MAVPFATIATERMAMILRLHHIGLTVSDLPAALAFWNTALGWPPVSDWPSQHQREAVLVAGPNCHLELVAAAESAVPVRQGVNEAGITHFCAQSRTMAHLHPHFAQAGASFHNEPLDLGTGNLYCYARDPEANVVELEALPHAPDDPPWMAHVSLSTPDIERTAAFYQRVLGGAANPPRTIGPFAALEQVTGLAGVQLQAVWLAGLNVSVELTQYLTPPTVARTQPRSITGPGYSHICFQVENAHSALADFLASGAQQVTPVQQRGGLSVAFVRDPDGVLLELLAQ